MDSPWHTGERRVQERVGEAHLADRLAGGIRATLPPVGADFLAGLPQIVLAAADGTGAVWVTVLTGPPGFLDSPRPEVLTIASKPAPGDPLVDVLAHPVRVGLIGLEPGTRTRVRLNGRSRPRDGALEIELDQVFANCPKHIQPREVVGVARSIPPAMATFEARLDHDQTERLAAADTFFVGTTDDEGNADASHRGGPPGVIEVLDPGRLRFPDFRGNSMYQTLGNLDVHPAIGLLVLDWATGAALHVTGRATVDYELTAAQRARFPRAQRLVTVEIDAVVDRPNASPLRWADAPAA